jgi:hypothetical protein
VALNISSFTQVGEAGRTSKGWNVGVEVRQVPPRAGLRIAFSVKGAGEYGSVPTDSTGTVRFLFQDLPAGELVLRAELKENGSFRECKVVLADPPASKKKDSLTPKVQVDRTGPGVYRLSISAVQGDGVAVAGIPVVVHSDDGEDALTTLEGGIITHIVNVPPGDRKTVIVTVEGKPWKATLFNFSGASEEA